MSNLNDTQTMEEDQISDKYYFYSYPGTSSCQPNFYYSQNVHAPYQSNPVNASSIIHNNPSHHAVVPLSGMSNQASLEDASYMGLDFAQQFAAGNMEENKPRAVIRPIFYREFNMETDEHTFASPSENQMARTAYKQCVIEKPKRNRTVFTEEQKNRLNEEFKINRYLDQHRRQIIAESLGLTEKTVKVQFQNQRMKEKRHTNESVPCDIFSDDDVDLDMSSPESNPMQLSPIQSPEPSTSRYLMPSRSPMDRYNFRYLPIRGSPTSGGYSNVLEPVQDVTNDFHSDTSFNGHVEELARLTVNLIPNPEGRNVPIATSRPDNGEGENANCNTFSIAPYMNLDG